MKFQLFKRLVSEDFDKEQQSLIGKISAVYNPLVDQLNTGLHNNLDFNNFNQQVTSFVVSVSATGVPTTLLQLTPTLSTSVKGILCIDVANTTDSTLLTGAPFVAFTRNNGIVTINQITGLVTGKKYNVTVILIG